MHSTKPAFAVTVVTLLLLLVSNIAVAQPLILDRIWVDPGQVQTIRIFYNPNLSPPHAVMEIFLKDQSRPGYILRGEDGKILESFHYMQELAAQFKKQRVVLLIEHKGGYLTETNPPFFNKVPGYSKRMYNIVGFYGYGFSTHGGPPPATIPVPGKLTPEPPPPPEGDAGFCCLHGNVVEAPARACQIEGGVFFRDAAAAQRHCQGGNRR